MMHSAQPNEAFRIVVLTGDLSYPVRKGIVVIDQSLPGLEWLVVIHSPRRTFGRLMKSQWWNLKRSGWRWVLQVFGELRRRFSSRGEPEPAGRFPGSEFTAASLAGRANLRIIRVLDIHAAQSIDHVRNFDPHLGLSIASPVLRPSIFSLPRLGTINLHKGRLPEYRGMPPAFWELWNDEAAVGCSIHQVDSTLDTGDILRETTVGRDRYSTLRGLQLVLDEIGIDLMRAAVADLRTGSATRHPQRPGGRTFRKPTLSQMAELQRKLSARHRPVSSRAYRLLKDLHASTGWVAWRGALQWIAAPRVTVLLYHRVSDGVRDNLTVGIEQFDRQMALLRRHCRVVSIDAVVDLVTITRADRPMVAVTFDDGYADNYENAAPILMRHGLPAAFFVSTGLIDSNGRFPHDQKRGNPHIPLMNWAQLRRMRDWGFTIGSHSVSHIDCAAELKARVRAELFESRDRLHAELGQGGLIFAYPYGGRQNMTPQRLELVKQAGYVACLSAYGGTNISTVDRFNVLRRGIYWEFSDRAFLLECLGFR